ncbi:MAG TPA: carboxypeptidase regulatory-like domain-containing protein [Candidatus Dormibacteraeota bacterium]|nr:carboxypeptidase regulatory-like domain-containing protein [Candidatus Dormibacteraeota bacterium]
MSRVTSVGNALFCLLALLFAVTCLAPVTAAQAVNATLSGRILDTSGGAIAKASVTAINTATGFSRAMQSSDSGDYTIPALPPGEYNVTVEFPGFGKQTATVTLQVGQVASLDFTLTPGQMEQRVEVAASSELTEPTRTEVSTVITERQIVSLPVNGREFIDFALLSPAVTIGDTTAGNTDVIVEPVTKLSFAGQNIHFNFIAVDGADDISTASGIQRGTPPQESVQEFRVINTDYSTQFGRATAGIVNIITRSGTNDWHGTLYEYFRNDKLDAISLLQANGAHVLRQNQFGAAIGGPLQKDKTFFYANYEAQRRGESPFYNSAVLQNIAAINQVKTQVYRLAPEPNLGSVLRTNNSDNGFFRLDRRFSDNENLFVRYFVNDGRLLNQSPLNDGFDLPSAYKNNFYRDQSLAGTLASVISPKLVNEVRLQYARRSFDFPTVSTQPHLELSNTFATGVNRGNPDFYRESRFELVDNVTSTHSRHTISFGGNYNFVRTQESFPLFYPFEADFATLGAFLGNDGVVTGCTPGVIAVGCQHPNVIFFERFDKASNFTEPSIDPAVYRGTSFTPAIRNQAQGILDHTYNGLYIEDKWRATTRLTLNGGIRWEWETWPSQVLNTQWKNFDPRIGLAYDIGTKRHFVVRAGFGLFHGIIPAPLLMCQAPSCGGTKGKYPGRDFENGLDANTRLFAFASAPNITALALRGIAQDGAYPDNTTDPFTNPFPTCKPISQCGFFGDAVVVRFNQNHQNPYGIQASLAVEFQPLPETSVSLSVLHVRGVHLGSFYNVNQPDPSGSVTVHDSQGRSGPKNVYCGFIPACPFTPGTRDPRFAIYFEATSRWDSTYDGLLVNVNKRVSHNFAYGVSYTFSKSIDNGPNPSFVLIPQDSKNFRGERALSSDDVRHRLVLNATVNTPKTWNVFTRNFLFSTIATMQSPMRFTKFAGFDANGDIFGNNDRVGIESRNTFVGDNFRSVDFRIGRTIFLREKTSLELIAEAFNLFNTTNIRFFNTVYGAADFCPLNPTAFGCTGGPFANPEGSPNPAYGTPRAINNPRQIQLALKFNF